MSCLCMIKGVGESVKLGPHVHTKGWGIIRGISKWCVICQNGRDN
jgi:hypothetical protein